MKAKQCGKRFFAILLIIIGILLCMNTIFAHNYSNDWNFGVIIPSVFGVCCFVFSGILLFKKEPIFKSKKLRTIFITVVIICLLVFITVEVMIIIDPYIHGEVQAGHVDTVIVLGCGIWPDGRPTLALQWRLDKAVEYYEKHPDVDIIVTGGQGPNEPYPESLAMEEYLINRGIPLEQIIQEDKSTSTRENFEFSRRLVNVSDENETIKIVFITNDFHVFRSRILAKRFGFEGYAISAPTPRVIMLNSYLREFFAFVKSMLVDY